MKGVDTTHLLEKLTGSCKTSAMEQSLTAHSEDILKASSSHDLQIPFNVSELVADYFAVGSLVIQSSQDLAGFLNSAFLHEPKKC